MARGLNVSGYWRDYRMLMVISTPSTYKVISLGMVVEELNASWPKIAATRVFLVGVEVRSAPSRVQLLPFSSEGFVFHL